MQKKWITISLFLISITKILGQRTYLPVDTLDATQVELLKIDLKHGNIYCFKQNIPHDSIYLLIPPSLPRGYYEAYYDGDTNQLALTYYRFGNRSYAQQYYQDGTMKSDTEYDRYGLRHGMHVLYNRLGEEIWHVNFYRGQLEKKYSPAYIEAYNYTQELVDNSRAWGCYEFFPTPMRARHDQIILQANGTFSYFNLKARDSSLGYSQGKWMLNGNQLHLMLDKQGIWPEPMRVYVILANRLHKRRKLIWLRPWGAHWYASEYKYCRRCQCSNQVKN